VLICPEPNLSFRYVEAVFLVSTLFLFGKGMSFYLSLWVPFDDITIRGIFWCDLSATYKADAPDPYNFE